MGFVGPCLSGHTGHWPNSRASQFRFFNLHRPPFSPVVETSSFPVEILGRLLKAAERMEFEKRKAATMASLGSTETDKSPKGSLDTPIIPLINTLNRHPSYFTTSSCSGRISILSQPISSTSAAAPKPKKKALGGSWLFVSHEFAEPNSVIDVLFRSPSTNGELSELVFRFEPLIIAVECKDLGSAQTLVSTAISCGFRESGITSASKRVIIAIRCSIRMEVPLGTTEKIMVSPEYVRFLVDVANEKMVANKKRTDGFLKALESSVSVVSNVSQTCHSVPLREAMEDVNDSLGSKGHGCADDEDYAAREGGDRNANSGNLITSGEIPII